LDPLMKQKVRQPSFFGLSKPHGSPIVLHVLIKI
jgi:hypothetical protein